VLQQTGIEMMHICNGVVSPCDAGLIGCDEQRDASGGRGRDQIYRSGNQINGVIPGHVAAINNQGVITVED
jgi:hypothetical protein